MQNKNFRIFVADDDQEDIQLLRDCLVENKVIAEISEAANGNELLEKLRNNQTANQHKPHLILLDINMPRKNGFETLKELKEDKNLCTIPVIVFSTSGSEKDIEKAYELGANCYVSKPRTAKEWVKTIGSIGHFWCDCAKVAY